MSEERFAITPQMKQYLEAQLEAGEQVLWAGTTDVPGRTRRLWPLLVASVFLTFLCSFVFWNNPSRWVLVLLSLLVWAGIPVFVYLRQTAHLRHTLYAITDRRALILSVGNPKRTESYPPQKIEFVHAIPRGGGRGDLLFVVLRGTGTRSQSFKHGFLGIEEVARVARLMRETLVRESPSGEDLAVE
jgi:hypothetical protein